MPLQDLLWEKAEPLLFISKEAFLEWLEGWTIEPVYIEGELAFATLQKGPLFHFQSFDTKHPIKRKMIREFLGKIIAEHGYAETRTPIDDERQHHFNRLMGFEMVGEDAFDTHFRIERLPHA